MAFPGTGTIALNIAYVGITSTASRIKQMASDLVASPVITRKRGLDYANSLADALALLTLYTAVPGLLAYVRNELNDPTIDIVAEFNTMRTQLIATQDWLVANFPATAGELRVYTFNGSKRYADINLTAPQLSAFKTQLNALIATIN